MMMHGGNQFTGKRPIYGQVVYYLDQKQNTLLSKTSPGIFVGWKIESGYRYRGVLLVADYEVLRKGIFQWGRVKAIHEREVHVPGELCFPFAEARAKALKDLSPSGALPSLSCMDLPFDDETGNGKSELEADFFPEKITPKFRITLNRLIAHGVTPGCIGCANLATDNPKPHTDVCKERFQTILQKSPSVAVIEDAEVGETACGPREEEDEFPVGTGDETGEAACGPRVEASSPMYSPESSGHYADAAGTACGPLSDGVDEGINLSDDFDFLLDTTPSAFAASAATSAKQMKGVKITYDMSDYVQSAVDHYIELSGNKTLKPATTPFCPEGSLLHENEDVKGELGAEAASILMKNLWAARLARPDLSRPTSKLTTKLHSWSSNDDRRLRRLMEYMLSTKDTKLTGFMCDRQEDLELWLFVDADLAGDHESTRSSNGAFLVLVGPSSWMPISWLFSKQTSTSKSTTEAEGVSLVTALLQEAYPVLDLLEMMFNRPVTLRIKEDNTAAIKVLRKGYSTKLRHVQRTHKLNLGIIKEAIEDHSVRLEHVETDKQVADLFTKDLAPCKWPNAMALLGMAPGKCVVACGPICPDINVGDDVVKFCNVLNNCGALTACNIIDDICDSACPGDMMFANDAKNELATVVRACVAKYGGSDRVRSTTGRGRPSSKLPGWGRLVEVCADEHSNMGVAAKDFKGVRVLRITKAVDWSNKETVRQLQEMIRILPGVSLHASLMCTPWTTWQAMNIHKHGFSFWQKLMSQRKESRRMLQAFIETAELALALGGEISFEWPASCRGWLLPELIAFVIKHNLHSTHVDGCSLGMVDQNGDPVLKRWRFVTSSKRVHDGIAVFKCTHKKGFRHAEIQGSNTPKTAMYPFKLCRTFLAGLFGWYEFTAAMVCTPLQSRTHRYTVDDESSLSVESACGPLGGFHEVVGPTVKKSVTFSPTEEAACGPPKAHRPDETACGPPAMKVPTAVTKLLNYKETRYGPKAVAAVQTEVDALAACGTWDASTVAEKSDVIEWAKANNVTVHFGEGLAICSIKNSEMPESLQKHKGRFCFRAPTAKDQNGSLAIFQELSSKPVTIVVMNVSVAYGSIKGNKTTVADAIKAYVQSDLKCKDPTYIEIPRYLCPRAWAGMTRPVCRLIKALYGHPEAGAHWERHLSDIVKKLGGAVVPSHPSCFFFAKTRLLLSIYVDDLMLSGPESEHEKFWAELGASVNIEPPEDLDRYLGRYHTFSECVRTPHDVMAQFESAVLV